MLKMIGNQTNAASTANTKRTIILAALAIFFIVFCSDAFADLTFFSAGNKTVTVQGTERIFFSAGNMSIKVTTLDANSIAVFYSKNITDVPVGNLTISILFGDSQLIAPSIEIDQQGTCDIGNFTPELSPSGVDLPPQNMTAVNNGTYTYNTYWEFVYGVAESTGTMPKIGRAHV